MSTTIRGHSDDIISVQSAHWHEELTAQGDEGFLALSTGDLIHYQYDGCWRFDTVHLAGGCSIEKCSGDEDDPIYSDVLVVPGDARWALAVREDDAEFRPEWT